LVGWLVFKLLNAAVSTADVIQCELCETIIVLLKNVLLHFVITKTSNIIVS